MPDERPFVRDSPLRTPRAAAIAGILFALLLGTAISLVRHTIPADPSSGTDWLADGAATVKVALGLVPFAGIAFLWFMGVVRDRFGPLEDRFYSTVFLGSGLLFLAMLFVWAGTAGGLLASYSSQPDQTIESGIYAFGHQVMYGISSIYLIRMAGVFMISLGTIWIRTGTMHRWLAILTYGLALLLLFSVSLSPWVTLVFPLWVLIISVHILFVSLRSTGDSA